MGRLRQLVEINRRLTGVAAPRIKGDNGGGDDHGDHEEQT